MPDGRAASGGVNRFAILRGGSRYQARGSHWYMDGGPQEISFGSKSLLTWPGMDRCATVGFRCVVDLERSEFNSAYLFKFKQSQYRGAQPPQFYQNLSRRRRRLAARWQPRFAGCCSSFRWRDAVRPPADATAGDCDVGFLLAGTPMAGGGLRGLGSPSHRPAR
jgi:hypothetical protein